MADDISVGTAVAIVVVGGVSIPLVIAIHAYSTVMAKAWRRLRVWTLGGVTTLEQTLNYNCALCQYSLDAREEVRTLSCNHVFHFRAGEKCVKNIDYWLRENSMICPLCRKTPHPVLPWKAPPPPSPAPTPAPAPAPSPSPLPAPAPLSSPSPSPSAEPPLPLSSPVLEEPLLPPLQ
ncbi:uncharacterized protein LOC133888559 [Phragmites australis]|uniref:uncharacterized protein LOC133888559 n=1 Tax=Phragmites australis TaxID=29695 RepID=UPI002D7937AF|nr:uncharacterized protein LOC133888559 [Phragmites australis]